MHAESEPSDEYPRFEVVIDGNTFWLKLFDAGPKLDNTTSVAMLGNRVLLIDGTMRPISADERDHIEMIALELGDSTNGKLPRQ